MKTKNITQDDKLVGIIEEYSKKEIMPILLDYLDNLDSLDDESICVDYNDGTFFYLIGKEQFGDTDFRRTGIKRVIIDNGSTFQVYGDYTYRIEDGGYLYVE